MMFLFGERINDVGLRVSIIVYYIKYMIWILEKSYKDSLDK